eukprot:203046-Pelagomonas_calceolata.AAC.1
MHTIAQPCIASQQVYLYSETDSPGGDASGDDDVEDGDYPEMEEWEGVGNGPGPGVLAAHCVSAVRACA